MPDPSKPGDWLNKIPAGLTAVFALIGAIAAFVIDFRERWQLFTTITLALLLGYLFTVSLYVALARRKTKSKKNQWTYSYGKYRPLGLLGLVAVCLAAAGLIAAPATRQFALESVLGTQTPIPTSTSIPTSTPVPSPTSIPTPTPPQLAAADVVIARFHPIDPGFVQYFEAELEAQLQAELRANGLPEVSVRLRQDLLVANEEEAQDAANRTESKVVIWGQYSPNFIQVKVFLSGGDQAGTEIPGTDQIALTNSDPSAGLAFQVPGVVAENLRFLAPFVLGHLHYHSNNYAEGRKAFDSAMANIPANARVESDAIVNFFRARERDRTRGQDGSESLKQDTEYVICEYKNALLKDPRLDIAYNNLGLVISRSYGVGFPLPAEPGPNSIPTEGAMACLQELQQNGLIGPDALDPTMYFRRALEVNSNLTLAKFNLYAFQSLQDRNEAELQNIVAEIEKLQQADESILGTYMILASAKERLGDIAGAIEMYRQGIDKLYLPSGVNDTDPKMELMRFNMGQLLAGQQDWSGAEAQIQPLLEANPNYYEAHLALGNLYYRQRRFADAAPHFDTLVSSSDTAYPGMFSLQSNALMLRAGGAFQEGNLAAAIADLNRAALPTSRQPFPYLLLGLSHQVEGSKELALEYFNTALGFGAQDHTGVWGIFQEKCLQSTGEPGVNPANWILESLPSSDCLGRDLRDPNARLIAFYDLLSDEVLQDRERPSFGLTSAQCPFVYTDDPLTGEWSFQTTILFNIVDHEAAQLRPLHQFHGRLLIREQEPEISYLNRLYVLAEMRDGSYQILEPDVEALKAVDADYIVLHNGEEILVTLDDYPAIGNVRQWWVMAVGYYSPVH